MANVPGSNNLRILANQSLAEQDKAIDSWEVHLYSLSDLANLKIRILDLPDSGFKKRIANIIA